MEPHRPPVLPAVFPHARAVRRLACGGALTVILALGVVTACTDAETPTPCTDIPEGGCPLSHGVACDDPACHALYACRSGNRWELTERCAPRDDASTSSPDTGADASEASTPELDASIDAPPGAFGGPGCGMLQTPDCMLGFALSCAQSSQTCCDCEDLFVCENGGWSLWGTCGDAGPVKTP